MENKYFKEDAKQIVDMCFDTKLFKDTVTRDDMNGFEELIAFLLKSKYETYIKVAEFNAKVEKL